ncbi:cytochrome P450 [Pleomassaria siparia CBS 279.74]|uniref:Cytochrome P450 n=1 Tax=Pleomassaria siparia CBS 279.74 TaxID=1314801 RepID=A0A6G1K4D0_9PLEO|nr:cytochrome P450 [Pleomassaria siparia CBS 279.74]
MDFPILVSLFCVCFIYILLLTFQRLHLSPISHIPGPKLAAATFWYEFYYDIILGGKYIWKIKALHEQYGPIIRINPYELHVIDPDFWDIMYTASTNSNRRDKWSWQTKGIGIPASLIGTVEHALHRVRRGALNPFFSMQNVRKLLPVVEERVEALIHRLKAASEGKEIVKMEYAFSAYTNDVVMQYCFGRSEHHIEAPGFDPLFHVTSFNAAKSISLLRNMNWILDIMLALPESVAMKMGAEVSSSIVLKRERINQIEEIRCEGSVKLESQSYKTIFHTLLQSDLPAREKETDRLAEEAVLIVGAGTHTTSWILTVITFNLLSNPALLRRLKDELKSVQSGSENKPSLIDLERLPFLTGVLKEGIRLGYGTTARSARIAPDITLQCNDWTIPAGTPVSMTIPLTHHNESIFPNSDAFEPDRWLREDAKRLDKYLVSFSKGSRACAGLNLAWAELYLCIAGVFSHFGSKDVKDTKDIGVLELFGTDESDVKMVRDMFFPIPKDGSKGVRVKALVN